MKKIVSLGIIFLFFTQICLADIIETKTNKVYKGKIIKTSEKGLAVRTEEGNTVVIPKNQLARIQREKKVYDFLSGEIYYLEKRRPFLPFSVFSVSLGVYSVTKFQDYQRNHKKAEEEKKEDPDVQNLKDESGKDLAVSIGLGICSVATFILALKPIEVKVPVGKISMNVTPTHIGLALSF